MGGALGILVEVLVAVLLLVTIGYCVLVNRKLEQIRSDQSELRQIIRELNTATGHAQAAIAGLRENADSAEAMLADRIEKAGAISQRLDEAFERGDALLSKLTMLTHAARHAPPAAQSDAGPRRDVRAAAVGLGLLNARQRAQGAA